MHLPVVVWSDSSIKALGLKVTTSAIAAPHDTVSIVMVCGTEQGTLLLFRSTTSSTWELDCLMLRHTARIVGLAMAVNEWGEFVCVSVDVQGSVGIWLLRDGRCMDWKPHVVSELTPLLGLQVFSNQRYALAYGEQGTDISTPNASLVLLVWQSKFAVFHRTWLEPGHDTRHHDPTRTTFYFGGVHGDAVVEFVDGGFTDNHTILLSTSNHTLYSFPAVVRDNVTAQVGQVFVFQQVDDMEIPQSVAYSLARVDLPATPHVVIPTCQCPRPNVERFSVLRAYAGKGRRVVKPQGLSFEVLKVHGYANGKLKLHALGGTASTAAESPPPPMTLSLPNGVSSCRIVALAHLSVTRVFKPSAAVYESYADSPTGGGGGPLGLGFQAAKLTKISTLLHKLQQHSLTPRPSLPSHSTATNHVSATTIPATTRSTTAPSSTSPSSIPVHSPSSPLRDHPVQSRVCLIFAGTSTGHVVISQLIPNVSWTVLRTFHRHSQSITSIYVTPSSRGTMILASVGADRKMTLYAVHQHEHDSGNRGLEMDVLLECVGHADDIVNVEWAFETNHVFVECADRMMYIWSLTTGILERIVPHVMVHQTTHHKHTWDLLRPLSSPPRGSASMLPNVHVFPCDVDVPAGPSTRPSSPFNDHVTALLAYLLTWHDDAHIDQLVRDMLGTSICCRNTRPRVVGERSHSVVVVGVIKRLPENLRSTKAAAYMTKFQVELQQLDKRPGGWVTWPMEDVVTRLGSYLVVLSILGTCFPGEISPSCARQVCEVLVACLHGPSHVAIVAAELLAKGLLLFRPHLTDVGQLVLQLIPLTLDDDAAKKRLKQASMRLLVEVGTCEASFVLTVLQQEMNVSDRSIAYREGVLAYLMTWVNLQFRQMVRHLPAVVDTVLSCLDPTKPDRRKKCLAMSTKCLHDLVKRFPMVDFHKATQRLAVGTMDGVILLYDLRMVGKSPDALDVMCGFPLSSLHTYVEKLVRHHGEKVAICNQVESAFAAKQRGGVGMNSLVQRQVVRVVTPGSLTEDSMLMPTQNNYLAALSRPHESTTCQIAYTDISTGEFHVLHVHVDDVDSELCRLQPSELLVPSLPNGSDTAWWLQRIQNAKAAYSCAVTIRPPPNNAADNAWASAMIRDFLAYTHISDTAVECQNILPLLNSMTSPLLITCRHALQQPQGYSEELDGWRALCNEEHAIAALQATYQRDTAIAKLRIVRKKLQLGWCVEVPQATPVHAPLHEMASALSVLDVMSSHAQMGTFRDTCGKPGDVVVEELLDRRARLLFATHFTELDKAIARDAPVAYHHMQVVARSVESLSLTKLDRDLL
ncbi:hypothetical protein DYB32_007593 [Aphanomyces invadans]|uniref:Uncharacterized protein n=1 Tax=Aphanomyces invadans TaxID=157072 RepID=A0A3R6VHW2_9STRA|nr:hypothetical protein DYB32_007593 [Aphanomyces invadans]